MKALREAFTDPELMELIILADAVSGLMHELNNGLNRIALQTSVIQMEAPGQLGEEVGQIRQETGQAAALLRPLQMVRQRQRQVRKTVDLNEAVPGVLAALPELADRIRFEPGERIPPLPTSIGTVQRLVAYFLRLGLAGTEGRAGATLHTSVVDGGPRLTLEQSDRRGAANRVETLFDPQVAVTSPESLLERLAFQSLLRLAYGTLSKVDKPVRGVALTWPAS